LGSLHLQEACQATVWLPDSPAHYWAQNSYHCLLLSLFLIQNVATTHQSTLPHLGKELPLLCHPYPPYPLQVSWAHPSTQHQVNSDSSQQGWVCVSEAAIQLGEDRKRGGKYGFLDTCQLAIKPAYHCEERFGNDSPSCDLQRAQITLWAPPSTPEVTVFQLWDSPTSAQTWNPSSREGSQVSPYCPTGETKVRHCKQLAKRKGQGTAILSSFSGR
jgi:hypothetical protein